MSDLSIPPPPSGTPPPPPGSPPPPPPGSPPPTPPSQVLVSQANVPLQTQFQPSVYPTHFYSAATLPMHYPLQGPFYPPEWAPQHHLSTVGYYTQPLIYPPGSSPYSYTLPTGSAPSLWTLPPDVWMYDNVGAHLQTIVKSSIEPSEEEVTSAGGYQSLCSYNWVVANQQNPTIYVPGCPRFYWPLEERLPVRIHKDWKQYLIDQHVYRAAAYPFDSTLRALDVMKPDYGLDDVDIVCDRNSLLKLLEFATGKKSQEPFCLWLNVVNNTLLLKHREKDAFANPRTDSYTFNFIDEITEAEEDMENAVSYHRVIEYKLGGLRCVVRFDVDAKYDKADACIGTWSEWFIDELGGTWDHEEQYHKGPFEGGTILPATSGCTTVIIKGKVEPHSAMAKIKTTRAKPGTFMSQLWFARIPYLIRGRHESGYFHKIETTNMEKEFKAWEERHQDSLRKLVSLLVEMRKIAVEVPGKAAVLMLPEKGADLKVHCMNMPTEALPADLLAKYWENHVWDLATGENRE